MKLINVITENPQLADKVYFKTGRLSSENKDEILTITKGDNFTKLLSDFLYILIKNEPFGLTDNGSYIKELKKFYDIIKNYNPNVFPIKGYDLYDDQNPLDLMYGLDKREKILNNLKKLPSVAIRNLKDDIRIERDYNEISKYLNDIEYFMGYYSLLDNRNQELKKNILDKMFSSTNTTIDDLINFAVEKENLLGGKEFTREDILELIEENDVDIVYQDHNTMILEVYSPQAIKAIGCNSLWCFTYGKGFDLAYREWNNYSYNDIVYVLIDFREKSDSKNFMHVLIKPLIDQEGNLLDITDDDFDDINPLYDMSNHNYSNPYSVLKHLFGDKYKKIIKQYLNFGY